MGKDIVIHSGLAWEVWYPDSLYTTGIGGSETWVVRLAECLAKDNNVVVFGPMENQIINQVSYKNTRFWDDYSAPIDVLIVSRYPQFLSHNKKIKKVFLQVHDIFPMNDNGLTKKHLEDGTLTAVICLTSWHRDYVAQYCNIPKDNIRIVGNGI